MPDLLDLADALKAHLSALPAFAYEDGNGDAQVLPILVDRQLDRDSEIAEANAKALGACLLIGLSGWDPVDTDDDEIVTLDLRFSLSIWSVPIMETGTQKSITELIRDVLLAVAAWCPAEIPTEALPASCCRRRWQQGAGRYIPNDSWVVYEWPALARIEIY